MERERERRERGERRGQFGKSDVSMKGLFGEGVLGGGNRSKEREKGDKQKKTHMEEMDGRKQPSL